MSYSNNGPRPSFSRSFGGGGSRGGGRSGGFSRGGGRGGFGGGRGGRNQGPRPQYIDPSRYVVKAVPQATIVRDQVVITNAFADFGFHPELLANVQRHGYTIPTPIQDQAIPVILQDKDVVGIANTGTGKTAAFLLPLIHKFLQNPEQGALIVVPTRELATQIADEFRAFSRGMKLSMALCVGGVSIIPQLQILRRNPHFIIGTPGRIKDLLDRDAFNPIDFANIVLDEVDRMLDIGFVHDIRYLITQLPTERRSYFFSATMTRDVESIMRTFLKDPVTISVRTNETPALIEQDVVRLKPGNNKIDVLFNLLSQPEFERVIVFGRTKHGINTLEEVLSSRGLRVDSIHGNKTQNARQRALDQFKRGRIQALLATDVAARGIDIPDVTHVINYDEPNSFEDYTHRIGRTGRAGKVGKALTFVV